MFKLSDNSVGALLFDQMECTVGHDQNDVWAQTVEAREDLYEEKKSNVKRLNPVNINLFPK